MAGPLTSLGSCGSLSFSAVAPAPQEVKRRTFVNGNVIGLIALDQVLGLLLRRVVYIALEAGVGGEFPDNYAAYTSGFRIPADMITDFEHLGCTAHTVTHEIDRVDSDNMVS